MSATTLLTDQDLYLFNEGTHYQLYRKLGAHRITVDGKEGVYFAVWAPNATRISVIGDFNFWDGQTHPLTPRASSGIWEGFVPEAKSGQCYKYRIWTASGQPLDKADPIGFLHETPPKSASIIWDLEYEWNDSEWMNNRGPKNSRQAPMSIYEVHLGSWMPSDNADGGPLGYRQLGDKLADYAEDMGFTHVELMPIMEHPFYGSWGYQVTGYFAPTHRYGKPQDLMYLIDTLHQRGIGVLLDWVPAHFPSDGHSLGWFDGTHLYEHADTRKGFHPDWKSLIFNYGRYEVRAFLLSSAQIWLDYYHVDGLRVDGVASMLYLDYSRNEGEWIPNEDGSNENRDAISLLRSFNEHIYEKFPDVQTVAEESTAWGGVSRPTDHGGLGFGFKWDMGWMHDTLKYMSNDPIHRKYHHDTLTFRAIYTYTENFVLPLSHDEVVHGKGSLLGKMPGDDWQKMANLRLLLGYMFSQPGKKLLFMGGEIAAKQEWNHDHTIEWGLLQDPTHKGMQSWVRDLNQLYRSVPALHEGDVEPGGFEWVCADDRDSSALSFLRFSADKTSCVIALFNFTPVPRHDYRVGVPVGGYWREIMNSDASTYGGTDVGCGGGVEASAEPAHGRPYSISVTLPPLGCLILQPNEPLPKTEE